ncbi:unnamed protein product, partial [Brachionus calyciflorus]
MTDQVFNAIPRHYLVRDKIDILIKRHRNNYFLDQNQDDIDQNLDELVRPKSMVTEQNLNKSVSRDYRAKIRKVDWVLKCNEPFATPFKENINNDSYTSINNMFDDAARIYRRHSPQYNEAKATVSSENRRRVHKRKEQENQESESDESQPNENIRFTKDQILNEISRNYIQFKGKIKFDFNSTISIHFKNM